MEQLVWYLYFIDIRSSVVAFLGAILAIALLATIAGAVMVFILLLERLDAIGSRCSYDDLFNRPRSKPDHSERLKFRIMRRACKYALSCTALCVLLMTIIPSERTLLAFVGVEATQELSAQIAGDPRMQRILSLIDAKLDAKLDAFSKETEKHGKP